jgi:flagellar motor switch protein FliM
VTPEVQDLGTDASLIQVAGANDVVVTSFFEVNLGNRLGAMSICTPYTVLEQVAPKLLSQVWLTQGRAAASSDQTRRVMRALLGSAPLELVVELGATEMPARSITELREGDTLVLDARVDRALSLLAGGHERFLCRPGMLGNRLAVRVSDVIDQYPMHVDDEAGSGTEAASGPATDAVPVGAPAAVSDQTVMTEEARRVA